MASERNGWMTGVGPSQELLAAADAPIRGHRVAIADALPIGEILGAELISTLRNGHPALLRLYQWVQANDPLHLTMREASAISCLEPHYFSCVFHRQTTLSFTEWRMRLRVFRAADLIATGEVSIDQVVERVGYDDRRSLERATKRLLGITPRALRASRSAVRRSSSA